MEASDGEEEKSQESREEKEEVGNDSKSARNPRTRNPPQRKAVTVAIG